jgi:nucleoporin NDC1
MTVLLRGRAELLFGDEKYNPTMRITLVRSALLTLGKDYKIVLRRGAPPPPGLPLLSVDLGS